VVLYRGKEELLFWNGQLLSGPKEERKRVQEWANVLKLQFLAQVNSDAFP